MAERGNGAKLSDGFSNADCHVRPLYSRQLLPGYKYSDSGPAPAGTLKVSREYTNTHLLQIKGPSLVDLFV